LNINILAIGKVLNSPYSSISDHYIKNIQSISKRSGVANFTVNEVEKSREKDAELRKQREFDSVTKKLDIQNSINILLDEKGKLISSTKLKSMLYKYQLSSKKNLNFIIGGPDGTSGKMKEIADENISLSKMTLPHLLVRILLLEQIYRALTILINHPYHK
tara:strand:+ start:4843 stop:5325 length:483 start_codon:yes stop_codon:yes gene_type:complete